MLPGKYYRGISINSFRLKNIVNPDNDYFAHRAVDEIVHDKSWWIRSWYKGAINIPGGVLYFACLDAVEWNNNIV